MKFFLLAFLIVSSTASAAVDMAALAAKIKDGSAILEVHGAVADAHLYVLTYRDPSDFFSFVNMSAYGNNSQVDQILFSLLRHDRVMVKGTLEYHNTQPHVAIDRIDIVYVFAEGADFGKYQHTVKIPQALYGLDHFIGKVHALAAPMIVVEYGDAILPLVVDKAHAQLLTGLGRGDKIDLYFKIANDPPAPTHLKLNTGVSSPLVVLESAMSEHGNTVEFKGSLVLYIKSPQVMFNVFAFTRDMGDGVTRDYTLVNFDDAKVFQAIRDKLQAMWDAQVATSEIGRNKFINTKVRVTARGIVNYVDPSQANPQILLKSVADVQLDVQP